MKPSPQVSPVLPKLAERIRRGEVVFFVGAGFSIDSEGMSAGVIVRRLWIRLEALCEVCWGAGGEGIWKEFWATFFLSRYEEAWFGDKVREWAVLQWRAGAPRRTKDHAIEDIASRYYEFNEFLCKAYGRLLAMARVTRGEVGASYEAFHEELDGIEGKMTAGKTSPSRPSAIPEWLYASKLTSSSRPGDLGQVGKMVLMASFGFWDPQVMAGRCREAEHMRGKGGVGTDGHGKGDDGVAHPARDRLRLRHHVLARLAREGYCPTLVTTNFDLLLEEAMHASGLEAEPQGGEVGRGQDHGPDRIAEAFSLQVPYYDVISDPHAFYLRGKAFKTAVLLKIHGCAGRVRSITESEGGAGNESDSPSLLETYLRQVVYTYREIQNWRQDHWTADFLRTLLRTRALVFAGYSTQDPVIHDTFRSVYEEMERAAHGYVNPWRPGLRESPAYFLGYTDANLSMEFHANEVLHAASRSVGHQVGRQGVGDHPHYLRFGKQGGDAEWLGLDDQMCLLAHLVLRRQQAEAIRTELPALVARLTDERQPTRHLKQLASAFRQLEWSELRALYCPVASRVEHGSRGRLAAVARAMAWSHGFHLALRREWALGLALNQHGSHGSVRVGGLARLESTMRDPLWYFPASERPAWTAWGAVVELALRNIARSACAGNGHRTPEFDAEPTYDVLPTVILPLREGSGPPSWISLTIKMHGLGRPDQPPKVTGFPTRRMTWHFPPEALPWRAGQGEDAAANSSTAHGAVMPQPGAKWIWKWALGNGTSDAEWLNNLKTNLGEQEREERP